MGDQEASDRLLVMTPHADQATHGTEATPSTTELGQAAEREAVRHLTAEGYRVIDRNARTSRGEIDIVAWDGPTLCFVEVKSRAHSDYGGAQAAVDQAKQTRLWRAAEAYLAQQDRWWAEPPECRFDVVAMRQRSEEVWDVALFRDAFQG